MSATPVLVVAPHADDEVLGCGGTIARHVREGQVVSVLILGRAVADLYPPEAIQAPLAEARPAHSVLGVSNTYFRDFPAPRMETVPLYEIANAIREVVASTRAEIVYMPHRGDIHQDHQIVFHATLVATRPVAGCPVRQLLAYETLSETEWAAPFGDQSFIPNVYVDIEQDLATKLRAMACYRSQLCDAPHPRSLKVIEALARVRGATVGLPAAEAFALIRDVR